MSKKKKKTWNTQLQFVLISQLIESNREGVKGIPVHQHSLTMLEIKRKQRLIEKKLLTIIF